VLDTVSTEFKKNNPDACFSRLYFCHSLNRLQRDLSAIAELLVIPYERSFSLTSFLNFSEKKNGWLGRPLLPEILSQPVPVGAKSPILNIDIRS